MIIFFITQEQRRRAQDRAAALDVGRSNPPGQHPFVWDNRLNSVIRWYAYGSEDDKRGTICFQPVVTPAGASSSLVQCTTEITYHPPRPRRHLREVTITDPGEHDRLVELFFQELLASDPTSSGRPD